MTEYTEIFNIFLSDITDPMYSDLDMYVGEEDMLGLLNFAILNFEYPKIDLKDKDDDTKQFTNTLDFDEKHILAKLMVHEWATRFLNHVDLYTQDMTTNELKTFSKGNMIKSLRSLMEYSGKEMKRLKSRYYRREGNQSAFHSLGGDGT